MEVSNDQYTVDIPENMDHKSIQSAIRKLADRLTKIERAIQVLEDASHTH